MFTSHGGFFTIVPGLKRSLLKKHVLIDPLCPLCKATEELDHIFMNFLYAKQVWLCFSCILIEGHFDIFH